MKSVLFRLSIWLLVLSFTSCAFTKKLFPDKHASFSSRLDYKKTLAVYKDEAFFEQGNSSNTKVKIDLSDQRGQLFVNEKVAMDFPYCKGKPGKRTPLLDETYWWWYRHALQWLCSPLPRIKWLYQNAKRPCENCIFKNKGGNTGSDCSIKSANTHFQSH